MEELEILNDSSDSSDEEVLAMGNPILRNEDYLGVFYMHD